MDFLKKIIKDTGNEYASIVADGVEAGDIESFIEFVNNNYKKNLI